MHLKLSLDTRPPPTTTQSPGENIPEGIVGNTGSETPPRNGPASVPCTPPVGQRVLASSTVTGCQITAPLSPPAHYPSCSARRASHSHSRSGRSTSASSSSLHSLGSVDCQSPVPHWARPPTKQGKEGSYSSAGDDEAIVKDKYSEAVLTGDQRGQDGDYIEVIKGSEGRIAVRAELECYHIMCWLPGFS